MWYTPLWYGRLLPRPANLLEFVETSVFTKRVTTLGLDDAVRELQLALLPNPEAGTIDAGISGLRKVRIPDRSRGKGKRGGARVH